MGLPKVSLPTLMTLLKRYFIPNHFSVYIWLWTSFILLKLHEIEVYGKLTWYWTVNSGQSAFYLYPARYGVYILACCRKISSGSSSISAGYIHIVFTCCKKSFYTALTIIVYSVWCSLFYTKHLLFVVTLL